MPVRRSYDDPCGVARALDMVGDRWALLVVRELLLGAKRFRDLARGLPGMSENVLSARLRELETAGVVHRRALGPPASTRVYELTDYGADLEPVLLALAGWGSRTPTTATGELSTDALMLALRTTFAPDRAHARNAQIELQLAPEVYTLTVDQQQISIRRGPAEKPTAVLTTDPHTLRALVFASRPLHTVLAEGKATLDGDDETTARVLSCFPSPASVSEAQGPVSSRRARG